MRKAMAMILTAGLLLGGCGVQGDMKEESGPAGAETAAEAPSEAPAGTSAMTLEDVKNGTAAAAAKKEESVNIRTEADGTPREIRVEERLSGLPEAEYILDRSALTDIKNKEGDEEFAFDGQELFWQNHGEEVRYEGTASGELPYGVTVTYYLDGQEISPEELAGKSGDVRIRFTYENRMKKETAVGEGKQEMAVPVTAISMALLPEEIFTEAEVENGRLVNLGDQTVALGVAMPGLAEDLKLDTLEMTEEIELPEYVEIRAHAEKFKLDFTATILSPGMMFGEEEDKDSEDKDNKDDNKLFDDMKEIGDASSELTDGTSDLADGAKEFQEGLIAYTDGAAELSDGAASLAGGAGELSGQSGNLKDGAAQLASGLAELGNSLAGIDTDQLSELSKIDLNALIEQLNSIDLTELKEAVRAGLGDEAAAQIEGLEASLESLKETVSALAALPQAAGTLSGSLSALSEGVSKLSEGANGLSAGVNAYADGVSQLAAGASELSSGAKELASSGAELKEGFQELYDGIIKLKDGVIEFDEEGIQELVKFVNVDLKGMKDRLQAARDLGGEYSNYAGIAEGTEGSVRFIFESDGIG